jgi:hypothetical protein
MLQRFDSSKLIFNKPYIMKKITILILLIVPFFAKATSYTSIANGNWSSSSTWSPTGVPSSGDNVTIANTVTLNANESVNNITINSSHTLTVSGSSTLNVYGNFTNNGTFTCSTGTVTLSGSGGQTIGGSSANTFYNLTASGTGSETVTLGEAITISNALTISAGTFDVSASNYAVSIGGSFTNDGTFTERSGTVTFTGTGTINGTTSTTFYNFTVNSSGTATLGTTMTVNNNLTVTAGTLDCEQYQITGNSTGTITLSAGSTLILGSTSSSTNVTSPTGYTSAHASISSTSTVIYQANTNSQTIPSGITFGNLTISGGSSSITKTPTSSSINAVNLTVNVVTLSMTTKTLNITGNATNNSTISFTTGALNLGGNFTNSGTFTYGTGTVTFNGSANQQVNGSTTPSFYNFTEDQAASNDSVFLNAAITVNNTLTTTQGIVDCQKNQLTNSATPVVSLSPSSATICNGSSTMISASNYSNYIWFPSTGLSSTTSSSAVADPTATTTYTIYGINSHTYTCGVGTDVVTVNATPTVTLTPSSAAYCKGGSVSITAGGASTYTWSPSTALSATTGATVTATPTTTTTYTITGTGSDGCTATNTITVTVYSLPSVTASAYKTSICPGIPDTLKSTPSGGTTPYSYSWTPFAFGDFGCKTCQNTSVYPYGSTYTITVTDAHGCTATASQAITVYPFNIVSITGPLSPGCAGNHDTLIASTGSSTYVWNTGATTTSIVVSPTVSTTYSVLATNAFGCVDSAKYIVDTNCIGNGDSIKSPIRIVPSTTCNPASYSSLDSVAWFYFTPVDSSTQIVAISNYMGVPMPHVHRLSLYDSLQNLLIDEYMPDINGASEIRIDASRLHIGKRYYVRAARTPANANMAGNNPTPTPIGVDNASSRWSFQMCFRSVPVTLPLDSGSEAPSMSNLYYEGRGQVEDLNGIPRFDIKAYTNSAYPGIACSDSAVSFVVSHFDSAKTFIDTVQRVDMEPTGSNVQPAQRVFKMQVDSGAGYLNYFKEISPNGITKVYGYSRLVYKNIYNNVDMHLYSNAAGPKFYFVCNPASGGGSAGNPANIELKFNGATAINITSDSGLSIVTELGTINFAPGYAYEDSAGVIKAKSWHANFEKISSNVVRFHTGSTNTSEPLIIRFDQGHKTTSYPAIQNLNWSTYYGGTDLNATGTFNAITNDAAGNTYSTGWTTSTTFPYTAGVIQTVNAGNNDVIVAKFNSSYVPQWSTYYGGSLDDYGAGIGVDASGNVFITGMTKSPTNLPTMNPGGSAYYKSTMQGSSTGSNVFVLKLDPSGQHNLWSTYYGGQGSEAAYHLAIDGSSPQNVYIVGGGAGSNTATAIEGGAYNNTYPGGGLILKFNTSGVQEWGTTIGASVGDATALYGCAVDASYNFYITGSCPGSGYPVSFGQNAFTSSSFSDAVATEFTSSNAFSWSTYFGGDGEDVGTAITVDQHGNVYFTGYTDSPNLTTNIQLKNPGSPVYYQGTNTSNTFTTFIAEWNSLGLQTWGTYFGGVDNQVAQAITVDADEGLFITGATSTSTGVGHFIFPTGGDPVNGYDQTTIGAYEESFLAGFSYGAYFWGSYLGGVSASSGNGITDYNASQLYITGSSGYPFVFVQAGSGSWFQYKNSAASGYPCISEFDLTQVEGVNNIVSPNGDITVYPNPASNSFTVQMELKEKENVEFMLYNSIGQLVYYKNETKQAGRINEEISVSSLAEGIYLLKVNAGNDFFTKKVIKQN